MVLIKYSGKYVKIYFNMKITCFSFIIVFMQVRLHWDSASPRGTLPYMVKKSVSYVDIYVQKKSNS